jgi:hypothetical protein
MYIATVCLSKGSWTVTVVSASVKEGERGGQGHISQACCISLPLTLRCEHALLLHECLSALSTSRFVLSSIDGKIEHCVCIKFCVKLGKSATETLEMLHEAFGRQSLSKTVVFEWHLHFKASESSE